MAGHLGEHIPVSLDKPETRLTNTINGVKGIS